MRNMEMKRYSDMSIKVTAFFLGNIGLWFAENDEEERRMRWATYYVILNMSLAVVSECRDLYFTWLYQGNIFYVIANSMSVAISVIKVYVVMMHKEEFASLIKYMLEYFWDVNYDINERKIFNNCKKTCMFFISIVTTIAACSTVTYLITPFVAPREANDTERRLPFNMWLRLPLSTTPYYEIMFLIQFLSMYCVGVCYFALDNMFCILSIHVAGQFRILQYRLATLCNDIQEIALAKQTDMFYNKLKCYIQQHQALIDYCEKLENVYTMIIFAQVLIFSALICLFTYQIITDNSSAARRAVFIILTLGALMILLMFTYSCDNLTEQSEKVAVAAYSASWAILPMTESGRMLRKDLILIIERSRRVCCLTAKGFFPVSLETYTTILSTAASYFTMLRNRMEAVSGT